MTIAVRDLVSLSLTIPVLAADVDMFCKTMSSTFEARTGKLTRISVEHYLSMIVPVRW